MGINDRFSNVELEDTASGVALASGIVVLDANKALDEVNTAKLSIGVSGSEVEVVATPAELNRAADISARIEELTATKALDAADSDKIFMLNAATEFTTTLPAIADAGSGWKCKFIVKAAPSGAAYVITEKATDDTNKIITNGINELEVDTADDGPSNTGHTTVNFADGVAIAGDWVEFICDGTNWYCTGQTKADGGVTLA